MSGVDPWPINDVANNNNLNIGATISITNTTTTGSVPLFPILAPVTVTNQYSFYPIAAGTNITITPPVTGAEYYTISSAGGSGATPTLQSAYTGGSSIATTSTGGSVNISNGSQGTGATFLNVGAGQLTVTDGIKTSLNNPTFALANGTKPPTASGSSPNITYSLPPNVSIAAATTPIATSIKSFSAPVGSTIKVKMQVLISATPSSSTAASTSLGSSSSAAYDLTFAIDGTAGYIGGSPSITSAVGSLLASGSISTSGFGTITVPYSILYTPPANTTVTVMMFIETIQLTP